MIQYVDKRFNNLLIHFILFSPLKDIQHNLQKKQIGTHASYIKDR